MSEAIETKILARSPLDSIHARLAATMLERDGWLVPASYGDVLWEYAAVRESGAGLIDISPRGRIHVSGAEAVQFLNGLITNDMKTLAENSWMPAVFPNVQGRLIASVRVARLQDEGTDRSVCPAFLIDTEAATHERVLKTIERFTLAGDFRVTDVSARTAMLSVQGRKSVEIVRTVFGEAAAGIAPNRAARMGWPKTAENGGATGGATDGVTVMRATHTGEDGFYFIVNADQAGGLWKALQNAGARPVGYEALEILRIEAGLPRYGVDLDDTNVVTETALDDAVSYTKGCYVGQEIIARIKYRGHVARKLTGLLFERAVKVEVGVAIKSADDKEVGRVTSVAYSPHLGRTVAMGYLKYDYLASGTSLKITSAEEELPAQVTDLPFVRGSWPRD